MAEIRARQFMYMQDFDHLKIDFNDLTNILTKANIQEWAYIIHDKDTDQNDQLIRKHLHVVLKYANPQILSHVVRLFNDEPQYLEVWQGRISNAYSYLIHATLEAKDKYQYDPKNVVASFDFLARITEIQTSVNQSRLNSKVVANFLTQYANEEISYQELVNIVGLAEIAKRKSVIDNITKLIADKKHGEWLKDFHDRKAETIWLWGSAGVGKTRYANKLVHGENVAILGSSRDYFQDYQGEHYVVLNDLRPNDFRYADLLRLLDPYEHDKVAPRRYHDVKLNIEMLIITTPYSPFEFYQHVKIADERTDTFEQLKRRIHAIHITPKFIAEVFQDNESEYEELFGGK